MTDNYLIVELPILWHGPQRALILAVPSLTAQQRRQVGGPSRGRDSLFPQWGG